MKTAGPEQFHPERQKNYGKRRMNQGREEVSIILACVFGGRVEQEGKREDCRDIKKGAH